jgi:hypothetical protein
MKDRAAACPEAEAAHANAPSDRERRDAIVGPDGAGYGPSPARCTSPGISGRPAPRRPRAQTSRRTIRARTEAPPTRRKAIATGSVNRRGPMLPGFKNSTPPRSVSAG